MCIRDSIILVPLALKDPQLSILSLLVAKGDTVQSLIDKLYAMDNLELRPRAPDIELVFAEVLEKKVVKVFEPKTEAKRLEQTGKMKGLYVFETVTRNSAASDKLPEELDTDEDSTKNSVDYVVDNKYTAYNCSPALSPAIRTFKRSPTAAMSKGSDYFIHAFSRVITHDDAFIWKRYDPIKRGNITIISLNTRMTCLDLYDQAWKAVARYLKPKSKYAAVEACWWRKYRRVYVHREPKQPFIIRLVNSTGIACSKCNWREQCLGCCIMPEQKQLTINPSEYISLDWYLDTFEEDYCEINKIEEHESFIKAKESIQRPLNLKEIMKKFTMPEDLASAKCETCRKMTEHKKTLSISRFPVVLILHLKRYNEK
eukprot:TRINITY_DN3703_c0_g1_i16.p1 TRINITY_DN3703_c0_g1~~TRINITY_DN3703_c0_g1_i16.p1  ORF type:complete len:371 (-),score=88.22 TRINITY_DN3703_c0_g1_i16:783-1895(-)